MIKLLKQLHADAPKIKAFEEQYLDSLIITSGGIRIVSGSDLDKRIKTLPEDQQATLLKDLLESCKFYQLYYSAKKRAHALKIMAIIVVSIIVVVITILVK